MIFVYCREVLVTALSQLTDKVVGQLNDSVHLHNAMSMVLGKYDMLEGQVGAHLTTTRHLVDTSTSQLHDLSASVSSALNKLSNSKDQHDSLVPLLRTLVEQPQLLPQQEE